MLERGDGGNWKALISIGDAVDYARNRVEVQTAVYNANGELFAAESDDIWGSTNFDPDNPVAYRLDGTVYDGLVWTGSGTTGEGDVSSGNRYPNCDGWTSSSGDKKGEVGDASWSSALGWVFDDTELACDEKARVYCINGQ